MADRIGPCWCGEWHTGIDHPGEVKPALTLFVCGPNTKCNHLWGEVVEIEGGSSARCSLCGALAIDEAMWE